MKKVISLSIMLAFVLMMKAQEKVYQPTWESLDSRPVPSWFGNAKFGIFIHWGLYFVPAWSPKGTYAEWYKHWADKKDLFGNGDFKGDEVYEYHKKMYGEKSYADFAAMFKALDYNPVQWAELFEKAGAKYVVLTTKHHDGYALWPSKEASRDFGRPWNSVDIGPGRDLVGEFTEAVRGKGLRVGLYYSMIEWDSPLCMRGRMDCYVKEHLLPQCKELVTNYKPDLLWSDGNGGYSEDIYKIKDFLAWLYSATDVKEKVVVNDRWAKGMKHVHGDFFTSEYSTSDLDVEKPWEECRGIGFSFGLNRNEDIEDYSSPKGLVLTLTNIVARGGNLLLGIAPDANGKIPPVMQERLLQMGKWLAVNGEAIYDTHKWRESFQWSAGAREGLKKGKYYVSGDAILAQTVCPEKGQAVKEAFFTQSAKGDVYAILPVLKSGKFVLKNIQSTNNTRISMLGLNKTLLWKQKGKNIEVTIPVIEYGEAPCDYAWTLKMENVK